MLLLAGGAFGFALLVGWVCWAYRPMLDRSAAAPADAVAALTLRAPLPKPLADALPSDIRKALSGGAAYATSSATGTIEWHALSGNGRYHLVRKEIGASGFVRSGTSSLPLEIRVRNDAFIARIGRGFRGVQFPSDYSKGLIPAFPKTSSLYIRAVDPSSTVLGVSTWASLWSALPHSAELVVAHHENDPIQPFVIAATGVRVDRLDVLDARIKDLVGKAIPQTHTVTLPDRTRSKEIHSSAPNLQISSRKVSTGLIRTFSDPQKSVKMSYFLSDGGNLWISDHSEILQQFITAGTDDSLTFYGCISSTDRFTAILHPQSTPESMKTFRGITFPQSGFKSLVFSLKQAETGLFTFCGYL